MSRPLCDGEPCGYPGCLSHISHPCESCGRIGGISHEGNTFIPDREELKYLFLPEDKNT
jgi:hypothetical protein